ncbi:hypothetical protein Bpfe_007642 [Biomphalaria pfeifferi]|uniref:Uncharacterized protein n=1 Tax=Biomphalaria pfeifferi TaxID=112525 RepID=A0AAD8BY16_BIOPF|nr:hypothetical protein Bpfe_007642 [Biomphalaria pfeifferi]
MSLADPASTITQKVLILSWTICASLRHSKVRFISPSVRQNYSPGLPQMDVCISVSESLVFGQLFPLDVLSVMYVTRLSSGQCNLTLAGGIVTKGTFLERRERGIHFKLGGGGGIHVAWT